MPRDPLLSEFDRRLRLQPDHPVIISQRRSLTLAEVDAASRQVAVLLSRQAVAHGTALCLRAPNGPAFLALLLGALRHGAVPVLLDSQTPGAEIQRVMTALTAGGLLTCARAWPEGPEEFRFEPAAAAAPLQVRGPAVIKLTSGSTGAARGIEVPLPALLTDEENLAQTMGIVETDRLLAAVPMAHSYGLSSLAVPALVRGTTLLLPETGNPFAPLQVAEKLGATVFPTTPSFLDRVVQLGGEPPQVDSLRVLISAGAPLHPETARRIRKSWGRPVHVFYGASECGGIAYDREGDAAEAGLIGEPVSNVRIDLEDAGEEAGPGRRVVVQSAAVARGYLPDGDAGLGGGRFATEDLGSLENGLLRLHGRLGSAVKIRGKKVHPAEVEQVLVSMPGVREAHVHGVAGASGETTLEALVVAAAGGPGRGEILAWCRQYLAPEKVPRRLLLVPSLPRNERGKIDTRRLSRPQA